MSYLETQAGQRPKGATRTLPEIPATPYSKHIPARKIQISRAEQAAEWFSYGLAHRPRPSELMMDLVMYSPYIVVVGSIAVATADSLLNLGIAQDLADIKVNKDAGAIHQQIQSIAHDIGTTVVNESK